MCKSDRALPYISANQRSTSLVHRIRSSILNVPIRPNHGGRTITVRPWPSSIDSSGTMHFSSSSSSNSDHPPLKPDVVILATGYGTTFPMLDHAHGAYPSLRSASVRGIYSPDSPDVAYIGFVRPSIGAIPPLAELQAQLWTLRLLRRAFPDRVPSARSAHAVDAYEMDWQLHARAGYDMYRDKRGVDHESYAYQLALDMGAAPTWRFVMRKGWRCFYTWAMGSNFNTKFRLVGPWRDEVVAENIMHGELFDVVKRSGGLVCKLKASICVLDALVCIRCR